MKRKAAEEIASMLSQSLKELLANTTGWPDGGKLIEETAKAILVEKFLPVPELTSEKKDELRHSMKHFKSIARAEFIKTAKKLPKNPGGAPTALKPEEAGRACRDMATLLYQGVEKPDACKRIAARYGISPWTMGRYWRRYQQSKTQRTETNKR
jgi:hypothetical protein